MKISVDDKELHTISDIQKAVICNDIHADEFESDMKRRVQYILTHKYERCLERLKKEWLPKLQLRMDLIPTNDEQLAKIILEQPDYQDRKTREANAKALEQLVK